MSDHKPIFIVGSGRCGSTFLQHHLCRLDDIWIWGEHSGILKGLFNWCKNVRQDGKLSAFSFPTADAPSDLLIARLENNATNLAWMNGFRPEHLDEVERRVIAQLFADRLPEGKRRWGFKEIRYGAEDRLVEHLLELFPKARVLHLVRHPLRTAESSVIAWNYSLATQQFQKKDLSPIKDLYFRYLHGWHKNTTYYIDLSRTLPKSVQTLQIENLAGDSDSMYDFLGVASSKRVGFSSDKQINRSKRTGPVFEAVSELFQGLRAERYAVVATTAQRLGYTGPE